MANFQLMSKKGNKNPAFPYIEEFHLWLLITDHNCYFLDRHLKSEKKKIQNAKFKSSLMVNRIPFRDLSDISDLRYSIGLFQINRSEDYLNTINSQIHRNYERSLAEGFELFETYLKNISALILCKNNNLINHMKSSDYKNYEKTSLSSNNFQDWRTFVNYSLKNTEKILKFIKKILPAISNIEKNNIYNINLFDWAKILAKLRHSIIHHNPLSKNEIAKWPQKRHKVLAEFFPGRFDNNNYLLQLSYVNIKDNFRLLSEYSFLIFKYWSEEENYNWFQFEKINAKTK